MELIRHEEALHVTRRSLLRFADFRRVIAGQFISQSADAAMMLVLASTLLFADPHGPTPLLLGQAAISAAVPLVLAGPIAGAISDRWPRKQVLVTGQAVRSILALAALAAVVIEIRIISLAVFVLAMCTTRVLYTARVASIRHLVRQHELVAADSLMLIVGVVAGLVGVAMFAGFQLVHLTVVLGVVAVGHFAAAYSFDCTRAWLGGEGRSTSIKWSDVASQIACGKTRYALMATSAHRLLVGLLVAAISLEIDERTGGAASGYAATIGVVGLAGFVGSITAEWVNEHLRRRALTIVAFGLAGISLVPAEVFGGVKLSLCAVGIAAFAFQNLRVASDATIQANAKTGTCGRVFALYDVAFNLAYVVGILVGLILASNSSGTLALGIASPAFLIFAVVFAVIERDPKFGSKSLTQRKLSRKTPLLSDAN